MNVSLMVGNLIWMIHDHIMMDPTFGMTVDMLPGERCMHHLHPTGSMIFLYVVVKMDIEVIAQMPPPPIALTQILVLLMSLIGLMVKKKKIEAPVRMALKLCFNECWISRKKHMISYVICVKT